MILITSNKSKQLLCLGYTGRVAATDFANGREDFQGQLGELKPGFTLLVDFSQLESMDLDCAAELGRLMKLAGEAGVGRVIRVIPDPQKDIGMNILTAFNYPRHVQPITCPSLEDTARLLGL